MHDRPDIKELFLVGCTFFVADGPADAVLADNDKPVFYGVFNNANRFNKTRGGVVDGHPLGVRRRVWRSFRERAVKELIDR